MTRSWTSAHRFSHAGTYWRYDDIVVEPRPAQLPHPPLLMAAGSDSSVARAASAGHNLILDQYVSPGQIADRVATYRDHLAAHPFDAMNIAVARHVHVADTAAETAAAQRRLEAGTRRILSAARDPDRPSSGSHALAHQQPGQSAAHALYGTPQQVADEIAALREAGVSYVLLILETDFAQLHRFHHDVLPRLSDKLSAPTSR